MKNLNSRYIKYLQSIQEMKSKFLRQINAELDNALDDANEFAQRPMYKNNESKNNKNGCCK